MLRKRMSFTRDDRGFTILELMVVVLVIAILIAIAIPTFLGSRQRAQDRAAQSLLRSGLIAMQVMLDDNLRSVPNQATMITELNAIEPSISWVDHVTNAQEAASTVGLDNEPTFATMATGSSSGNCYYVRIYTDIGDDRHVAAASPCRATMGKTPPRRPAGSPTEIRRSDDI